MRATATGSRIVTVRHCHEFDGGAVARPGEIAFAAVGHGGSDAGLAKDVDGALKLIVTVNIPFAATGLIATTRVGGNSHMRDTSGGPAARYKLTKGGESANVIPTPGGSVILAGIASLEARSLVTVDQRIEGHPLATGRAAVLTLRVLTPNQRFTQIVSARVIVIAVLCPTCQTCATLANIPYGAETSILTRSSIVGMIAASLSITRVIGADVVVAAIQRRSANTLPPRTAIGGGTGMTIITIARRRYKEATGIRVARVRGAHIVIVADDPCTRLAGARTTTVLRRTNVTVVARGVIVLMHAAEVRRTGIVGAEVIVVAL